MVAQKTELASLFTGDEDTMPSYRFHLALALCDECTPWTIGDLFHHVYPGLNPSDVPARACEMLIAAFQQWEEKHEHVVACSS